MHRGRDGFRYGAGEPAPISLGVMDGAKTHGEGSGSRTRWWREPRWLAGIGCFALPLVFSIAASLEQRFFLDDAMIYLTYAKNVATGLGWTFNPGANDHAATSALHTAIQSLLYWLFYQPTTPETVFLFVKGFEAIVVVAGVWAFFRLLTLGGVDPVLAGCAVAAFVCAKFVAVFHLFSGMETPLYLLCLMLAVLAYSTERLRAVGFTTGLLYLVRPEAVLVGPILAVFDLATGSNESPRAWFRKWLPAGAIAAVIVIGVGGLFYLTKGSVLPESAEVKLLTASNWGTYASRLPDILAEFWMWTPLAALGVVSLGRRSMPIHALLLCCACLVLLFIVMGLPRAPWYYTPFNVGFFTLVAVGLGRLLRELDSRSVRAWPVYASLALVLVAVEGTGLRQAWANRYSMKWHARQLDGGLGAASRWLAERADATKQVAAGSIGYVGYYGRNEVVDIVGLLEPEVARQTAAGNPDYWFENYRPDFVIRRVQYRESVERFPYRLVAVFGDARYPEKATGVFELLDEVASR